MEVPPVTDTTDAGVLNIFLWDTCICTHESIGPNTYMQVQAHKYLY